MVSAGRDQSRVFVLIFPDMFEFLYDTFFIAPNPEVIKQQTTLLKV